VTIWNANEIEGLGTKDKVQLTVNDADSWSAFTLCQRERHLIVYNPAQSEPRINSVAMHELSHIMLGHELASAGLSEDGHLVPSNFDQEQEAEADWLGGTLLLPRPALLGIRRSGLTDDQAMNRFLVSQQMLNWRFRMTGVDYQITNSARKPTRSF
jgi:Zn-dependent peptidase ImmA (M78 family)